MELNATKKLDTNKYELEVTVGAEEFEPAVERAFRKNVKKLNIPGFRKGKAPKSIVYKMYGEGVFYEDAVNELYPKAYDEAVGEAKLEPVAYPKIEVTRVDKDGFTFKAEIVNKPTVELAGYKGIKAEKVVKTVGDGEVEEELGRMRQRNARILTVTDRPAQEGDTAIIDFEGFIDGTPFDGGKGERHELKLGSGHFIPGFEEQVAGHSAGEEFSIQVKFPEDYHENLGGKEATFNIKLHEVKEEQLPALDDEFAKDVSEFDTLEELKADVRGKIQKRKDEQAQNDYENALMDKVLEGLTGEIPDEMIESKMDEMMQNYEFRLRSQGIALETYLQYMGQTPESFRTSFRTSADKQVRTRLALEKIAQLEGIEPTEEDVQEEYARLATRYGGEVEKIKAAIPEKEIRGDVAVTKAIDVILEHAQAEEIDEATAEARRAAQAEAEKAQDGQDAQDKAQ